MARFFCVCPSIWQALQAIKAANRFDAFRTVVYYVEYSKLEHGCGIHPSHKSQQFVIGDAVDA